MNEQDAREEIARCSALLWSNGWVANHDGNVTVRLDDGRILATPTAASKRLISADHVIVLGPDGKLLDGQRIAGKAFSELHSTCAATRSARTCGAWCTRTRPPRPDSPWRASR
jgi:L-fuculose-phosphate aldolase